MGNNKDFDQKQGKNDRESGEPIQLNEPKKDQQGKPGMGHEGQGKEPGQRQPGQQGGGQHQGGGTANR